MFRKNVTQTDRFAQAGGLRSRRNLPDCFSGTIPDLIVMTGDSFFYHYKTGKLSGYTLFLLFFNYPSCNKILGEFGNPSETPFERRGCIIDIISVKTVSHLQP